MCQAQVLTAISVTCLVTRLYCHSTWGQEDGADIQGTEQAGMLGPAAEMAFMWSPAPFSHVQLRRVAAQCLILLKVREKCILSAF